MYFLYGVIESIGHLSDDQKRLHLLQERRPSTATTVSNESSPHSQTGHTSQDNDNEPNSSQISNRHIETNGKSIEESVEELKQNSPQIQVMS